MLEWFYHHVLLLKLDSHFLLQVILVLITLIYKFKHEFVMHYFDAYLEVYSSIAALISGLSLPAHSGGGEEGNCGKGQLSTFSIRSKTS